jgi:hypothetical protein
MQSQRAMIRATKAVTQFERKSARSVPECTVRVNAHRERDGTAPTKPSRLVQVGFVAAARFWGGQPFASFRAKLSHDRGEKHLAANRCALQPSQSMALGG